METPMETPTMMPWAMKRPASDLKTKAETMRLVVVQTAPIPMSFLYPL